MKIMARVTLALFVSVFAANANAVGILVPKDMNAQERQAYIEWKLAALKSAGVIQQQAQAQDETVDSQANAPAPSPAK